MPIPSQLVKPIRSTPQSRPALTGLESESARAQVISESLSKLRALKGSLLVVKYGGSVIEESVYADSILSDLVFLQHIGVSVVVVHGGGKEISSKMREAGIVPKFINGLRFTDRKTISIVDSVLTHSINPQIVRGIASRGGKSAFLSGKKVLAAKKMIGISSENPREKVSLGFVGDIMRVNKKAILSLLKKGIIPVITPLAAGSGGETLNINADIAAARIAGELKATHLIFLSDVNGILEDPQHPDSTILRISQTEIQSLRVAGVIHSGMLPKVSASLDALKKGVRRVKMLNGQQAHVILVDLFVNPKVGTEVVLESNG